jgi:hypothetical protein
MSTVFFEALVVPGGLPLLSGPTICHGLFMGGSVPALAWAEAWARAWAWVGGGVWRLRGCPTLILLLPFVSCVTSSPGTRKVLSCTMDAPLH